MSERSLLHHTGFSFAEDEKLRSAVLDHLQSEHEIIIESIYDKLPGSNFTRTTAIGLCLYITHLLFSRISGEVVLFDWSFLICLIISLTLGFGYIGIRYMRDFVSKMAPLTGMTFEVFKDTYIRRLDHFTSARYLLTWGVLFGVFTMVSASVSGLWYESSLLRMFILALQFFAGFLNGCIIGGMWGIIRLIYQLGDQPDVRFKSFDPDNCGGTLLVGRIIIRIGLIFLTGGSIIAFYVWISPWTHADATHVKFLIRLFTIFPFFATLCVFALPVFGLHSALLAYKTRTKEDIRDSMQSLSSEILSSTDISEQLVRKREVQRHQFEQLERMYILIDNMNTWPYNLNHRITIGVSALLGPATGQIFEYITGVLRDTSS